MALLDTLGLKPLAGMRPAGPGDAAASAVGVPAKPRGVSSAAGPEGGGSVKAGGDVEVVTREFAPLKTKYGELKVSATLKIQPMAGGGADGNAGFTGAVTSKDKSDGRTTGTKKTIAYTGIADRELFAGFKLQDLAIAFEPEISGLDVSVSGLFKFTLVTNVFKAPAQVKVIVLNIKGGKTIQGPGIEIKIAPVAFPFKVGPVETKVLVEYKASFIVDAKKVGLEIGKEVVEKVAKEALKREAERQGVKLLGRKAAEIVLRDLGPLAAAFGVGLDIGALLNQYTIAPQVAKVVTEDILGDLNERYHRADTLGKMWLLSKNSPRIVAALVAAGVSGAVAGMADVVLFKIMGLDKLKDFGPALEAFGEGLTVMAQIARAPVEAFAGGVLHGALVLGIKLNPKHAICAHAALEPIVAAIFARIHPLYKMKGGLDKLLGVHVRDASVDTGVFLKFATFAHNHRMDWDGQVDLSSPQAVVASLKKMHVGAFVRFLEANKMLRCDVSLGDNLDPDAIDAKLLDELYG
jgi:hypothetical protein